MKKTRIVFIAHNCRAGGSLVITQNMLRVISEVLRSDEELFVIYPSGYGYEEISLPGSTEVFCYRGGHNPVARSWFERVTLPRIIHTYKPDVIYGAGNIGLYHPESPQAIFIHTPYPVYDRKHYAEIPPFALLRNRSLGRQIRKCLCETKLVLAQTPIMQKRISERLGYPLDQIRQVRFPPPAELMISSEESRSLRGHSGESYRVLVLTRYLTHRNPSLLIPFCQSWKQELRERKIQFVTTVNQDDHSHAARFLQKIQSHHLEDIIRNVGGLSREEVKAEFMRSDVLLFPSLMETLGMPYLEAMMMGVPILTTDLDFSHYVCGDAAIYYNPWDLNSLRERLFWLQDHRDSADELVQKGREELADPKKFACDWKDSTEELFGHLRSIIRE